MTSLSLNQNPILHNLVLSTQITLTVMALTNSNYEYPWNGGAPFPLSFFFHIFDSSTAYRYYANTNGVHWPPEVQDYNKRFTKMLEHIKSRHDPTVTTVAQGVLEWKRSQNARHIGLDIQAWLDRFYLSRIGIRFLIGQRAFFRCCQIKFLFYRLHRRSYQHTASTPRLRRYNMYPSSALLSLLLTNP